MTYAGFMCITLCFLFMLSKRYIISHAHTLSDIYVLQPGFIYRVVIMFKSVWKRHTVARSQARALQSSAVSRTTRRGDAVKKKKKSNVGHVPKSHLYI